MSDLTTEVDDDLAVGNRTTREMKVLLRCFSLTRRKRKDQRKKKKKKKKKRKFGWLAKETREKKTCHLCL